MPLPTSTWIECCDSLEWHQKGEPFCKRRFSPGPMHLFSLWRKWLSKNNSKCLSNML